MLHGKELSYNNLLDLDSALRLIRHVRRARRLHPQAQQSLRRGGRRQTSPTAFERAYEGDPVSAFGGIVGLNRPVDLATAERMCTPGRFLEAILAPGFEPDALRLPDHQAKLEEQRPADRPQGADRPGRPGPRGP